MLNLTQLRHNVRKELAKTSVRKCLQLQDVDVVVAGDANEATAFTVRTAVRASLSVESASQELAADPDRPCTSPATQLSSYNDLCCICGMQDSPAAAAGTCKMVTWVPPPARHNEDCGHGGRALCTIVHLFH